ncbi:MHC class II antigen presentation inhibitor [Hypsugopox virus]|nr:MHC class II antigen presentation inhibitor [Hypsugopox virus]
MSAKYIYTPLGALCYHSDRELSKICTDLEITCISNIGDYKLATFDIKNIDITNINVDYLTNFYVSINGILTHCSNINRTSFNTKKIFHAFVANKNLIIVYNLKPIAFIKDKIDFYIKNTDEILLCSILEVYNYKNEYEFILNPTKETLEAVYQSCYICFSDENGWIIADCKNTV